MHLNANLGAEGKMEAVRGGKKKYTPTAASQLKLNPFNYSPEVEAWGARKKSSHPSFSRRGRLLYLYWNTHLKHSLHEAAWMSKFKSYITPYITSVYIMDQKKGKCEVSPVSWGPMDSVISVPSMLSSSSTTTLPLVRPLGWRKRHKQINKRQRKRTRQEKKKCLGLPQRRMGVVVRSWIS